MLKATIETDLAMRVNTSTQANHLNIDTTQLTKLDRYLVMKAGRYTHAGHMRRSKTYRRKLRTNLGRVIREVERQGVPEMLSLL
jgi:IS5 family transposase